MKQLFTLILLLLSVSGFAQTEAMLQKRAAQKVGQMNSYIAQMYDKSLDTSDRQKFKAKALNLFIGRGYDYRYYGAKKCVMMEVTSLLSRTKKNDPIREYFDRIINIRNYNKIEVTSTDIVDMEVSELREIDDDLYECTVCYVQEFRGYKDGRMLYGDRTKKDVQVFVKAEMDEDGAWEFIVLLGDTKATTTDRL